MTSNISDFDKQIEKAKATVKKKFELYFHAVAQQAFSYISADSQSVSGYGSPVLTGRYYASHRITINYIDTTTAPINVNGSASPYRGVSQSTAAGAVKNAKLGDKIYITNSVPYAHELEYEGKSRFKTPNGIYRVAAPLVAMKFKDVKVTLK